MANDLNSCSFSGRMGRDPEVRYSASGVTVTNFSLAVGKKYKNEVSTLWIKVVSFGKLAEIIGQYGEKGQQVIVNGPLQIQEWEDKTGVKRYSTEVIANFFQMVGDKSKKSEHEELREVEQQQYEDSDIPF